MKRIIVLMGMVAVAMMVADAQALVPVGDGWRITTADGNGADAELRESNGTANYGTSKELASRVDYNYAVDEFGNPVYNPDGTLKTAGYLRNSVSYMKFDVSTLTAAELADDFAIRMTYNNKNISNGRIEDSADGLNTGMEYFVLDPTIQGADWNELAMTPQNAPGFAYDGDVTTKGTYGGLFGTPTAGLTYLGEKRFDSADLKGKSLHLPVGGAFDFNLTAGDAAHTALVAAINAAKGTDHQTVTIVWGVIHDYTQDPQFGGVNPNWTSFNYVMNTKEVATLNGDPDSPWAVWNNSNANHDYSPMLTNQVHVVPEPATLALLGLGGLLLRRKR